jgi:hypothetical protein
MIARPPAAAPEQKLDPENMLSTRTLRAHLNPSPSSRRARTRRTTYTGRCSTPSMLTNLTREYSPLLKLMKALHKSSDQYLSVWGEICVCSRSSKKDKRQWLHACDKFRSLLLQRHSGPCQTQDTYVHAFVPSLRSRERRVLRAWERAARPLHRSRCTSPTRRCTRRSRPAPLAPRWSRTWPRPRRSTP